MPRTERSTPAAFVYHVLNRGNHRVQVFHEDADYDAFVALVAKAAGRFPVRVLSFCLMPNHFRLALWPETDEAVSAFRHWLLTTQAVRHLKHYHATGHVWQGRFRAFPIQQEDHLLPVVRHMERNPLRAGLVTSAEEWHWSSLRWHLKPPKLPFLHAGPMPRPADWLANVNAPQTEAELQAQRPARDAL